MRQQRIQFYAKAKYHLKENEITEAALLNIFTV